MKTEKKHVRRETQHHGHREEKVSKKKKIHRTSAETAQSMKSMNWAVVNNYINSLTKMSAAQMLNQALPLQNTNVEEE